MCTCDLCGPQNDSSIEKKVNSGFLARLKVYMPLKGFLNVQASRLGLSRPSECFLKHHRNITSSFAGFLKAYKLSVFAEKPPHIFFP